MRVWLAVTALLVTVTAAKPDTEKEPLRIIRNIGHSETRVPIGHGTRGTIGRREAPRTGGHGGKVVKAELIASHNLGNRGSFSIAGPKGKVIDVGQGRVNPTRGEKIITSGRGVPAGATGNIKSLTTVDHKGLVGNEAQHTTGNTASNVPSTPEGSLGNSGRGKRRGNRFDATDEREAIQDKPINLYQAAKIAATVDRTIPINLLKYGGLDRDALLRLSKRMSPAEALRLFGKLERSHGREISEGSSREDEHSRERSEGSRSEVGSIQESSNKDATAGNKREIFDIGDSDEHRFLNVFPKGDSGEVFGSFGKGSGRPIFGTLSGKGNSRERPRGDRRISFDLIRGKGDSGEYDFSKQGPLNVFRIINKGNSREKPGRLFGNVGEGLDIFGIFNKGDSGERHGGGLLGLGNHHQGRLFDKGAGALDLLGIFDKGSREKLNLFGNKGYDSREKLGGLFHHKDDSNERTGGLFANKGRVGGLFGKGLDILGIFNKGSEERSYGLLHNKGHSRERSGKGYSDSIETYTSVPRPSKEKLGGLFPNKFTVGGLLAKGLDILDIFDKGSREVGLFGSKGHSVERSYKYTDRDDSKEQFGSLLGNKKSVAVNFFDGLKDLYDIFRGR